MKDNELPETKQLKEDLKKQLEQTKIGFKNFLFEAEQI